MPDLGNPLRLVYDAIWDCLESKDDFIVLFPNDGIHQVRYDPTNDLAPEPDLYEPAPGDYPRCRIVYEAAGGINPNTPAYGPNSNRSVLLMKFRIEVCTGAQPQGILMDAAWAIYRGLSTWKTNLRNTVTWNSLPIVTYLDLVTMQFTDENKDRNRGTNQWIGLFEPIVLLDFSSSDLENN